MTAGKYDFTCEQDADFSKSIIWKDSTGTPINITGYTALLTVNYTNKGGTSGSFAINTTWNANGWIRITNAAAGTMLLTIPASITKTFNTWTNGKYDMQVKSGQNAVTRLLQGGFVVNPAQGFIV